MDLDALLAMEQGQLNTVPAAQPTADDVPALSPELNIGGPILGDVIIDYQAIHVGQQPFQGGNSVLDQPSFSRTNCV